MCSIRETERNWTTPRAKLWPRVLVREYLTSRSWPERRKWNEKCVEMSSPFILIGCTGVQQERSRASRFWASLNSEVGPCGLHSGIEIARAASASHCLLSLVNESGGLLKCAPPIVFEAASCGMFAEICKALGWSAKQCKVPFSLALFLSYLILKANKRAGWLYDLAWKLKFAKNLR